MNHASNRRRCWSKSTLRGFNPVDTYIRSGTHIVKPPLPYIPGFDGAGVVLEVGADVHRISVGDRVYVE